VGSDRFLLEAEVEGNRHRLVGRRAKTAGLPAVFFEGLW
jgi:hypothetical protein